MKINKTISILFFFLILSLITLGSVVHAATISGSIYESNGTTLITGTSIQVYVYQGDPCHCHNWVGFATTTTGLYTTTDLPEGTYYLQTNNMNQSNYVNEWWADPVSTISCSGAQSITVSTADITGKDFQLDVGYNISGVVYQSDGITPIPDNNVEVLAYTGDPCDDREWMGYAETSSGVYSMMGIPPGDYYLQTSDMNQSIYASEWWAETESVFYCSEAQTVTLVNTNTIDKNFQLDIGGSITGVVVNDSGAPQADIEVSYSNDLCRVWKQTITAIDGSFEIIGLPPGPPEIEIEPDVGTGLAMYMRTYSCLALGESSDLGTIELQYGALITGVLQDAASNPLSDVEVWGGAKFEVARGETDAVGSFELRLPVGTYLLAFGDEHDYSRMPVEITVNDVGTPEDLGILISYDASSGEQISGTVDYGGYAGPGNFMAIAFLDSTEITPENFGGTQPLATAEPDQGTGEYSLYVVPQAVRPGTTINVMLVLFHEGTDGWESVTVIDEIEGIGTSGTPAIGQDLAYSTLGADYTVSGVVKNSDGGIVNATVLFYKQPGDEFFGFAETDCVGAFAIYNVPAGTYRIAATAYGYDTTEWSATFNVVNANVTVPDIFMGSNTGDELALDFGPAGLWDYDGTSWAFISGSSPEDMTGWSSGLAMDFGVSGLWNFDGTTWTPISGSDVEDMADWANGLAVDFGASGVWNYDGTTWASITGSNPDDMAGWSGGLAMDFGASGVWSYDGTAWSPISGSSPEGMLGWSGGLAMDFGASGLWSYDGTTWDLISGSNVEDMADWSNGLSIDFGASGVWNYDGTTWAFISGSNPEGMLGWASGLAVDFGASGLWSYDGTTWSFISSSNVEDMDDVDLY